MNPRARTSAWLREIKEQQGIALTPEDVGPELFPDVVWLWQAFHFLARRRTYGMDGPLSISVEAMHSYLVMKGIQREDDIDLFLRCVPLLDDTWMEKYYADQEANRKKK